MASKLNKQPKEYWAVVVNNSAGKSALFGPFPSMDASLAWAKFVSPGMLPASEYTIVDIVRLASPMFEAVGP